METTVNCGSTFRAARSRIRTLCCELPTQIVGSPEEFAMPQVYALGSVTQGGEQLSCSGPSRRDPVLRAGTASSGLPFGGSPSGFT